MRTTSLFLACAGAMLMSACALRPPAAKVDAPTPAQWHAPLPASSPPADAAVQLPHQGSVASMAQWWRQLGDPVLAELIEAAQAVSPTVAAAGSRIAQARANQIETDALAIPTVDAIANASKSNNTPPLPASKSAFAGLRTTWELDVFGANRVNEAGANARYQGARAGWHDARVSVAAEVANRYYSLRACENLLQVARADAASRAETARLTELAADAGFQAPATKAQAAASAADARSRLTQQQAACDLDVKALVALTALEEPALRQKLVASPGVLPASIAVAVDSIPAQVLSQRPDVFAAEAEVAGASADVGVAQAARFPRLTLSGQVGRTLFRTGDTRLDMNTWSIGPLAVSVPLFDAGKRVAEIDAATARYDEAVVKYRASVRQAVREVEEALVNLNSSVARSEDAQTAVQGYRASFEASEALYQNGLANLFQLEEARRTRLAAEVALANLQRERIAAWIALYRAVGGGWSGPSGEATTPLAAR